MRRLTILLAALLVAGVAWAASGPNQKAIPQAPIVIACDDDPSDGPRYSPGPNVVRYDIWNTGTVDVCFSFCGSACSGQAPDRTSLSTCSMVLGAYAGTGTHDLWTVSDGLDAEYARGEATFECDSSATANLVITEWLRVR